MKWSNPERLDVYGVRLVGWPAGVPANNPSTLRANQNKQLLEAFQSGVAHFERLPNSIHPPPIPKVEPQNDPSEDLDDFSWAYDPDASPTVRELLTLRINYILFVLRHRNQSQSHLRVRCLRTLKQGLALPRHRQG